MWGLWVEVDGSPRPRQVVSMTDQRVVILWLRAIVAIWCILLIGFVYGAAFATEKFGIQPEVNHFAWAAAINFVLCIATLLLMPRMDFRRGPGRWCP